MGNPLQVIRPALGRVVSENVSKAVRPKGNMQKPQAGGEYPQNKLPKGGKGVEAARADAGIRGNAAAQHEMMDDISGVSQDKDV